MVVGHANHIASDGIGNAQRACAGHGQVFQIKVSADGRFQRFVCGAWQHQHMFDARPRMVLPAKPCVGTAHIP
jgi:hypothetical protein